MCATCGCGNVDGEPQDHSHPHSHRLAPVAPASASRLVRFEQDVLGKNDALAAQNRAWLAERGIVALNLTSSPGAGKTTLLERTIADFGSEVPICVIEGDQETALDAERIRATGAPAIQINTGTGCHLDAQAVGEALSKLEPPRGALVLIENVGNLVCPAMFDLGERAKVVIVSTTEGEDKPLKYPHMFRAASLMLLNKVDLLPHLKFDAERCLENARRVNPRLEIVAVSATSGSGMAQWYAWVGRTRELAARAAPRNSD